VATLTVGRVAMKIAGREAGKYCVVIKAAKDNFVEVTGPKVLTGIKRRRCNIEHLEPTEHQVKIVTEASDRAVIDALEKDGILKKLGLKKPSPEVVKGPEGKNKQEDKEQPKKEAPKKEKKEEGKSIKISIPTFGRGKKEQPKKEAPKKDKAEKKTEKPKKKPEKKK